MKRHLLKSLLLSVLMMLGVTNVQAESWSIDFAALGANYDDKTGVTISETVATIGGTTMGTCTVVSEPLNGKFVLQTGTTWMIRKANGLYQGNGGGRSMGFLSCTKGQTITIVGTGDPNPTTNATLKSHEGNTYVYTVTDNGDVKFTPARYLYFTSVSVEDPSASAVNYTVKYVDSESKEVKESTTGSGEPNASITLTETEKASFFNTGNTIKYIYVSDDAEGKTIASDGSTVVTITFREAATYNYTLVSSLGGTITSGSYFEGETINAPYPRYQLKDGAFYEAAATNKEYRMPIVLTADNASATIEYTAKDGANAVFFAEAESLEGMTNSTYGNIPVRASNALATIAEGDVKITTLPRGIYKFHIGVFTSKSAYSDFFLKFGIGADSLTATLSAVNMTEFTSEEFTLTQKADISFWGGKSHADAQFDYIWIEKTGDVSFDPATAIKNANFEGTAIDNHLCGYGKDMSKNGTTYYGLLDIDGWQKVVVSGDNTTADYPNSGMGGAVFAYGTEYQLRGNNKAAPAEGPEGTNGKALGFFGVWGLGGYYYQDVTLPAGTYTLNIPMYNQSGTQANESYTGFFVKDSDVKYTVAVNPAVGAWTVQSVNFTLETETTGEIRVGYKSTGNGSGANPMLFIDGVQLLTELDGAKALYNIALAAANTAAANEVVTGEEKTTLNEAIAANSNIDMTSVEAVKAATSALTKAVEDFNAAKASYETLAAAKALVKLEAWPYAAAAKKTAVEEAVAVVATSAEDATAKTTALQKAYRLFVESNALAEGVEGAAICTDSIKNPAFDEGDAGWTVTNMAKTSNEPWTDSQDNSTHNYMDKWNGSSMNISVAQDVTLTAGKYVLTAIARATEGLNLILFAGEATDTLIATGNAGNVFNRGWNDVFVVFEQPTDGTINIGMKATINNQWASFSNFRLAQLEKYEAPEPVKTDYTDLIVNADLTNTETKGWDETETKGIDGSGIVKVSSGKIFDFNQTIANLPAGKYKVTAQAAYRYSDGEAREADSIAAGVNTKFAKLYATVGTTTVDTLVQNRYDGASETNLFNGEGGVSVVNEKFVPNSSDAVKAWFAAGKYVNEVVFNLPADGAVTIGIVKTQSPEESDYTVIGPWTLTRLGDAEVEPEPEPEPQPGDDMTKYIVNPSFETGNLTGWTVGNSSDTGVKPNSNDTYKTEGCDGDYVFNTWWQGIPITQTVKGLPNGKYELKALMTNDAITAGNKACLYLLANGAHSEAFSSANAGVFAEGSMQFYVTDGTATIGAVGGNADGTFNEGGYYWYKADNFRLTYVEALPKIEDIEIPEGKMSIAAANAMTAAKEAGDVVALIQAVSNAKNSIAAYAHVKDELDFMAEEVAKTNVYTAAAKEKFDSICTATLNGYNEGTISDADANAFNIGSRLDGILPNLLLSAYTSIVDGTPYINTWSTEGNNDGSDFKTPFYEYWVGDNDALAANTITAKVEGLKAGEYDVTAWVRVRIKNGAEAPATGITMQANDGEAVNVAAGDQVGTSQMYLKEFTATGTVAEDGVLKINFNVAADNNISWLSFKNVKFEKKPAKIEPIEGISYSWESPAGEPIEWGGTIAYVNGDGNRLNYQNSGYYTICLNGKKANLTDTVASANAGKMVVTLDKAVAEGDTIAITGYITKKTSSKSSAYIVYENGTNIESEVFGDESNIYVGEDSELATTGAINTKYVVVSAEAAGSKTITMTRGQTGTNLFITKLQIIEKKSEPVPTGISTVKNCDLNGTIFNMNGQKVNKAHKGLYIINGKKVVIK